jgi:hypothetical protein
LLGRPAQTDFDKWVDEDEQDGAEDPTSGMEGMGGSKYCLRTSASSGGPPELNRRDLAFFSGPADDGTDGACFASRSPAFELGS